MTFPVFLIHYDAPEWCRSAVGSVRSSVGVVPAVVVIDNGGAALPPDLGGCEVVVTGRNVGYTGGANAGLRTWADRFPESEFAVIASHDLQVAPDCLKRLQQALLEDGSLGIVGPVLDSAPRSTGGDWRAWRRSQRFEAAVAASTRPVRRDWISGTCLMIRRSCAEAVGEFDEVFGSYVEDVDYCLRAGDEGWGIAVVPDAHAHGFGSSSTQSYRLIAENRFRLLVKRGGAVGALVGVVEAVVRLPGLLARGLFRRSDNWRDYHREASALCQAIPRVLLNRGTWRRA